VAPPGQRLRGRQPHDAATDHHHACVAHAGQHPARAAGAGPPPAGAPPPAAAGPRETAAPASPLVVLALWQTPDVASAVRVLKDMGARPRSSSDAGTRHDFTTKNGGLVAVHHAERAGMEPAFEYDGDVRDLAANLTAAGFEPGVAGESHQRSLRVRAPWGAEVRISQRQKGSGSPVR
jgi:hypothetical protein